MGARDGTGFGHQLRLLLWKNYTIKKRSPVVFLFEVLIPLVLFLILILIRRQQPPRNIKTEQFGSRPLPSVGIIPVLQSFCAQPLDPDNTPIASILKNVKDTLERGHQAEKTVLGWTSGLDMGAKEDVLKILKDVEASPELALKDILIDRKEVEEDLQQDFNISADDVARFLDSKLNLTQISKAAIQLVEASDDADWSESIQKVVHVIRDVQSESQSVSSVDALGMIGMLLLSSKDAHSILKDMIVNPPILRYAACHPNISTLLVPEIRESPYLSGGMFDQVCHMDDSTLTDLGNLMWSQVNVTALVAKIKLPESVKTGFQTGQEHAKQFLSAARNFLTTLVDFSDHIPVKPLSNCTHEGVQRKPSQTGSQNQTRSSIAATNFWTLISPFLCDEKSRTKRSTDDDDDKDSFILKDYESYNRVNDMAILAKILYSRPRILFTPNNTLAKTLIAKVNETFSMLDDFGRYAQQWLNISESIRSHMTSSSIREILQQEMSSLSQPMQDVLKPLIDNLNFDDIIAHENVTLQKSLNFLDNAACTWLAMASQLDLDLFMGFSTEAEVEDYFLSQQYENNVTVVAALVFENFDDADTELPAHVIYKIRQNATLTPTTKASRSAFWMPSSGPTAYWYYKYMFAWVQDLVDRAIIDLQAGRHVTEPGSTIQRMPYPCWRLDGFIWLIQHIIPLLLMLSWIYTVAMLVQRIVYEKEHRLKEVMKMMGLSYGVHWCAWFLTALVQMTLSMIALTLMLHYGNVLPNTNIWIIFIFLELFAISSIGFSFLISSCYSKAKLAAACAGIFYFLTYVPYMYVSIKQDISEHPIPATVKTLLCLFSTTSLGLGGKYFLFYELEGTGVQWNNIRQSPQEHDQFSLFLVLLMMMIDTFIYLLLAWYIENIHPGTYGIPRPWYFPFVKSYWTTGVVVPVDWKKVFQISKKSDYSPLSTGEEDSSEMMSNTDQDGSECFEPEPTDLPVGLSIRNLTKIYKKGDTPALDNLTLNLYEDQIMSYLGHNGAGKTTTMSVLTGMFPATSGHALLYGNDTRTDMDLIRQNLGMCPQHNLLFDSLTVEEHLWFYSRLKGMRETKISEEMNRMLRDLNLMHKRKSLVTCLSGGMQRKLSVAIAFVGGSRTVILDEPTAGVDPYSRRSIWDLLQKYKIGRTILLSTHHMDEAEILGDRIAVLSLGKLRCCGSPMYLKSVLGDGQHLHILKDNTRAYGTTDRGQMVINEVQLHVMSAQLVSETRDEIHIVLPLSDGKKAKMAALLEGLECKQEELGIQSLGITESSLEEVLIRVSKTDLDTDKDQQNNTIEEPTTRRRTAGSPGNYYQFSESQTSPGGVEDGADSDDELINVDDEEEQDLELGLLTSLDTERRSTNRQHRRSRHQTLQETKCGQGTYTLSRYAMILNHFRAMIIKRFLYIRRNRKGLISQIILPAVFVSIAMTVALSAPKDEDMPPLEMSTSQLFNLTQPRGNFVPFYNKFTSTRAQYYPRDASPRELIQTFQLPSGLGATCLLKKPFHSQYDKMALQLLQKMNNYSSHTFHLFSKYFKPGCEKVFTPGIELTNYVPHASVVHPHHNVSSTENYTTEAVPSYFPICQCRPDNVGFICPDSGYVSPPQFEVVTRDILQDITGTDEVQFYLYTTDQYRLHRYGGFTFGTENSYVPDTSDLGKEVQYIMNRLAVRGTSKIWINKKAYHTLPVYLNAMNNIILRANLPASKGNPAAYGITIYNHPMKSTNNVLNTSYVAGGTDVIMAIFIIVAMAFVPASFVLFLVHERSIKAKHLQFVSGVNPVMYWVSNYIWDMCNYVIPALCILGILLAFNIPTYVGPGNLQAVAALIFLYGWSITPMMYPASFFFNEPSVAYIVMIVVNLFTGITCVITIFMLQLFDDNDNLASVKDLVEDLFLIFPNYCLGNGLMSIALNQYKNVYYSHTGQYDKMKSAVDWDITGKKMVVMGTCGIVFFIFTILCEYRFFIKCSCLKLISTKTENSEEDEDVKEERERVENMGGKTDVLHLNNLTKVYKTGRLGSVLAVDKLCLGVRKGECFGLLGVNGAGKTTTFKMLTGDTRPSAGDAYINTYSVLTQLDKVHQNIGYCPQFDALFDDLTGREHLLMYARMRGVPPSQEKQVVDWAIQKLCLTRYADKLTATYSGGNKRKLSTAIALMGNPPLIYMDEPTTGMDPYSRRFLWDVIRGLVKDGKSILFTSHSMEECEALCSRLSIMVNGRLQCLGSIQHLKERFSGGYSISVRLTDTDQLEAVRDHIHMSIQGSEFTEARYKTLIFKVAELQTCLSEIFTLLEDAKNRFNLQDYTVCQNTLDNVFINFAVKQKEIAKYVDDHNTTQGGNDTHSDDDDLATDDLDEPLIHLEPRRLQLRNDRHGDDSMLMA